MCGKTMASSDFTAFNMVLITMLKWAMHKNNRGDTVSFSILNKTTYKKNKLHQDSYEFKNYVMYLSSAICKYFFTT